MTLNDLNSTKVVISTGFGSARLTKKAAEMIGCAKLWQKLFNGKRCLDYLVMSKEVRTDKSLVAGIERLEGDYRKFDRANKGCSLRIARVPKWIAWELDADPEFGSECITEHHRSWHADTEYREFDINRPKIDTIMKTLPKAPAREIVAIHRGNVHVFVLGERGVACYYSKNDGKWCFVGVEYGMYYSGPVWAVCPFDNLGDSMPIPVFEENVREWADFLGYVLNTLKAFPVQKTRRKNK